MSTDSSRSEMVRFADDAPLHHGSHQIQQLLKGHDAVPTEFYPLHDVQKTVVVDETLYVYFWGLEDGHHQIRLFAPSLQEGKRLHRRNSKKQQREPLGFVEEIRESVQNGDI